MTDLKEWLAERKTGISGTDITAICGLNPYVSAYDVYLQKTTEVPPIEDNQYMKMGRKLESVISELYEEESGKILTIPEPKLIRSKINSLFLGSPDRYIEADSVFEAKSTQKKIEVLPEYYYLQNQWYVGISGREYGVVGILERGLDFKSYTNTLNKELFESLCERALQFWNENVLALVPPEPQNSEDIKKMYAKHTVGKTIEINSTVYESVENLREIKQTLKINLDKKEKIEEQLKMVLLDAEGLTFGGDIICTWKTSKDSKKFNTKELQEIYPDLYNRFLDDVSDVRKFLLK